MSMRFVCIFLWIFFGNNIGALKSQVIIESRADSALHILLNGNQKYMVGNFNQFNDTIAQHVDISQKKRPFAIILGCSDSRVPPEIVFSQGIGDLYVIRVAGNIVDDDVMGSIEYAVSRLGVTLVVVLGHKRCGIINMLIKNNKTKGHFTNLLKALKPAQKAAKKLEGNLLDNTIRLNVQGVVCQIKSSAPILNDLSKKGAIRIVGAYYDLDNGKVELLL